MWIDNLNELRKKSGMSLDDISLKSGVPKGTLSKITAGITKNPSIETVKSIVYSMGYTLDDLEDTPYIKKAPSVSDEAMNVAKDYDALDEHGRRTVNAVLAEEKNRMKTITLIPRKKKIHLYDTPAAAGEILPCPGDDYREIEVNENSPADFAVRVSGKSMEPLLMDETIAFIQRADTVKAGECGIFFLDGGMVLKKYVYWNGKNVLQAVNRDYAYEDHVIDDTSLVKCYGKVLLDRK